MSIKAIIGAVVLAMVLIIAAFFLNRAQPTGTTPAAADERQLLDFRPRDVVRIIVSTPDATHTAARDDDLNWHYLTSNDEQWPAVISSQVLGALGDFSALESLNVAKDREIPDDASSIRVELIDGTVATVRFSREALGGKLLATVKKTDGSDESSGIAETVHLVDSNSILPLAVPGPAGWRVANALHGVRDSSRITLETTSEMIQLAKMDGRWTVRSPVSARANSEAMESLLETLALLDVTRFVESNPPSRSAAGLETPRLSITLERDVRTTDDEGRTRSRVESTSLLLGDPTDASGRFLFASPSPTSSLVMEVPSDRITQISTAPRNYLALTASQLAKEDVGLITVRTGYDTVTERGFRRHRGEWREMLPDGDSKSIDTALLDELLAFVVEEPGEPEPASTDEMISAGRVTLHDASGRPLESIDFGYTADRTVFARSGAVDVLYYDFSPPALLNLPAFSDRSLEPRQPAPITMPGSVSPSK